MTAAAPSGNPASSGAAERGVSETLRAFAAQMPFERGPILEFVREIAEGTPGGADVLDLGAGDAPYRELFGHTRYRTSDWSGSVHEGARSADIIAPAECLPVADRSFDLVLCTQVLEHVARPERVLSEVFRVLRAGGQVALTVPLLWEVHEAPHDYYRYTNFAVEHLLGCAGFTEIRVMPRGDGPTAIAQLLHNLAWIIEREQDELREQRDEAGATLTRLAGELARLSPLDSSGLMPLGWIATACRQR